MLTTSSSVHAFSSSKCLGGCWLSSRDISCRDSRPIVQLHSAVVQEEVLVGRRDARPLKGQLDSDAVVGFSRPPVPVEEDKRAFRAAKNSTRISRSSTMTSLSVKSESLLAYEASIRMAERRSGTKIKDSRKNREARARVNSYQLYKSSKSVPESMLQFSREIHQEERISRMEEIDLGEKTQEGLRLQILYDNLVKEHGREPTDEEWCAAAGKINVQAISNAIDEGIKAKDRLVRSNLRMVQSVVNT